MNTLTASDGHQLAYYQAHPVQTPRGGVLVIQEIFGVNAHIRSICDTYASHGYSALAPALFDRVERGVELGYDDEGTRRGLALINQLKVGDVLKDLQAGVDALAAFGRVGAVGNCWGGSWTWTAACKLGNLAAASSHYGAAIPRQLDNAPLDSTPRTPIILHIGEQDAMIPISNIDRVRKAHPDVPIYLYPSGHGFNCDARDSYHAESAKLALQRTLDLFAKHVG
jgi:carboxymethylenebutenolidase